MQNEKDQHSSVESIWYNYRNIANNPDEEIPPHFYFCDNEYDANECAELVIKGIKQATATSLWWYEKNDKSLPNVGDKYIITDWQGEARAIIEITKISLTPYNEITSEFAEIEGEGDKSLEYWRRVHRDYYIREMEPHGEKFREDMLLVCEYFKTIYTK